MVVHPAFRRTPSLGSRKCHLNPLYFQYLRALFFTRGFVIALTTLRGLKFLGDGKIIIPPSPTSERLFGKNAIDSILSDSC
jgi:hypothetical protein